MKKTNNTKKEFKEILTDYQKKINAYRNEEFAEKKLRVYNFVFVFVLVFIFFMNLESLEEGRKKTKKMKKRNETNDKNKVF